MRLSKHIKNTLIGIIKFLYLGLFVYAATSKLIDFDHFKMQLKKSPFISDYADWIFWGLPIVEYSIVGLFLFPRYLLHALYASFFLMTLFTVYLIMVLNFSDDIPCACGGVLSSLEWDDHIVFNIAFMLLAAIGIKLFHKQMLP
jgi:hypothetical protein